MVRPFWFVGLCAATLLFPGRGNSHNLPPINVKEAIETTRFQIAEFGGLGEVSYSPSRRRFAVVLMRGDLKSSDNVATIVSGLLEDPSRQLQFLQPLRTDGYAVRGNVSHHQLSWPIGNPIVWGSDDLAAIRWDDRNKVTQVFQIDFARDLIRQVTHHPTSITAFGIAPNGTILYSAQAPRQKNTSLLADPLGFVVTTDSAFDALDGNFAPDRERRATDWFLQAPGRRSAIPVELPAENLGVNFLASFSPDSRYAIVDATPASIPEHWSRYNNALVSAIVDAAHAGGRGMFAGQLKQLYLIDTETGQTRALLDAPSWPQLVATNVAWAGHGRSVVFGPTFLPVEGASIAGLAGDALIEMDVHTGLHQEIPLHHTSTFDRPVRAVRWISENQLQVIFDDGSLAFERREGAWSEVLLPAPFDAVRVVSTPNDPPVLAYQDKDTGEVQTLLNPNPELLTRFRLGSVSTATWTDTEGRIWTGRLYYPASYRKGKRFPLVIQTHGAENDTGFSLYGSSGISGGLGTGHSIFAAQPLAGRDMFVLQVPDLRAIPAGPDEGIAYSSSYDIAIEMLDKQGLIDRSRVGISGFSRSGWHVLHALIHSPTTFAAAIASDNISGGYLEAMLAGTSTFELENGGAPYQESIDGIRGNLSEWIRIAPPFRASEIRTPLRLQLESGPISSVLSHWEVFSRMRRFRRPVELFVVPNIERGSHGASNPSQYRVSAEGAVDWFDFWLNGREDANPLKTAQYVRWRQLRAQHQESLDR